MAEIWLSSDDFGELFGITDRHSRRIFRGFAISNSWNGIAGVVRAVKGAGGRSGLRYEVALSSLPEAFQRALNDRNLPAIVAEPERMAPASNQSAKIERRWRILQEVLETEPESPERVYEKRRAAQKWRVSIRTIEKWLARLERAGGDVNALAHQRPSDAGQRRVYVSRAFDKAFRAAGYQEADLPGLSELTDGILAAVWQSSTQRAGYWRVGKEVGTSLAIECRVRGFKLPGSAYRLSRRRIEAFRFHSIVDVRANDRKRYDDNKPRIRRDNSKFMPMEQIVMDVKPIDIVMRRPDGSEVWPKMIGFMDSGTHRIFCWFVMLNKGEGIRQEHVTEAFRAMAGHPEWGFPQQLYRDNGTEFAHFDLIRSALAMIADERACTIINAKPYSGASKPIESKFAHLDRQVFSQMKGYAGGNRMNKKTQTVGKPPAPYPGSFEEFCEEALLRITDFQSWELRSGPFKGKSPRGCYQEHVAAGWRPITVNPDVLDATFSKQKSLIVRQAAVQISGTRYRHPELAGLNGRRVTVAIPWRRGAFPLVQVEPGQWRALEPEMLHLPGTIDGAIEASRMQVAADKSVRALGRGTQPIDLSQNIRQRVTALPTAAAPAPLMDVMLSSEAESFAGARIEAETKRLALPRAEELRLAHEMRITENLKRQQNRARKSSAV